MSPSFPATAPAPRSPRPRAACSTRPGCSFDWDVQDAGADVMERNGGNPLPDQRDRLDPPERHRHQGPDHDAGRHRLPVGQRGLRKALDLYAQVRPCKHYPGVRTRYADSRRRHRDRAREHRGPLRRHRVRARLRRARAEVAAAIERLAGTRIREGSGISIKPISEAGTRRVVRVRVRVRARERPPQGDLGAQGQHHEVHRRALARGVARGRRARTPTSSSTTGSWTTCACSSCRSPSSTTCWCCRTSTATSSPTSAPA